MSHARTRLTYLDWARGLAVLVMIQGHAFDSWLQSAGRGGLFELSQILGGLPAPIFLFLSGACTAIVLDRMREKRSDSIAIGLRTIKRGVWILALAYAFRIEQFLVWYPSSSWTGVFRVDTLNCIAVSIVLVGAASIPFRSRTTSAAVMGGIAMLMAAVTPLVFLIGAPTPSLLLDYLNGNGHPEYFSIFSWSAFAFLGAAFGYGVIEAVSRGMERVFFSWLAALGIFGFAIGSSMKFFPIFEYGAFDYSLTSPHFFLIRMGCVLIIMYAAYWWSTKDKITHWSPLQTLGKSSLLIYWSHMELVYGRPLHGVVHSVGNAGVTLHLLWLVPCMLALAALHQRGLTQLTAGARRCVIGIAGLGKAALKIWSVDSRSATMSSRLSPAETSRSGSRSSPRAAPKKSYALARLLKS